MYTRKREPKLNLENINYIMYQNKTLLKKWQKSKQANLFLYKLQVKQQNFTKPKHQERRELDLNNNEINWPNVYKTYIPLQLTIH